VETTAKVRKIFFSAFAVVDLADVKNK